MITKSELLKEPVKCGSIYGFEIQSGAGTRWKRKAVDAADPNVQSFAVVGGESRVRTATLRTVQRTCRVNVGPYDPDADYEDEFPVYYLHWEENGLVRIKLKRSRRVELKAEPRVFFTANLNGCLVSVEGPADEPTVYHSNVTDYKGSPGNDQSVPQDKALRRIGKKVAAMYSGYRAMSTQHDNRSETHIQPGHISQYQYQTLVGRPSGAKDERRARTLLEEQARELGKHTAGSVVTSEQSRGAVFGVRDQAGRWAFYFQRQLKVRFHRVHLDLPTGTTQLIPLYEDWATLRCERFWPDGPSVMRF